MGVFVSYGSEFDTNDSSKIWKYSVPTHADLAGITDQEPQDIAYVQQTTGILFINQKIKGVWVWSGSVWEYGSQDLQDQAAANLAAIVSNDADITNLQNGKLDSVVAGSNVTVDNTDPLNPIISSTGGGGGSAVSQEYIRVTNTVAQPINTTGATALTYDTQDKNSDATMYTLTGGQVVINQSGRYRVKAEVSITSLNTARADPKVKMLLNGVAFQDVLGRDIVGYGLYARNSGAIEDSSHGWEYVIDLTTGDTLQACLLRNNIDLNGVSTIPDGTYLEIFRLDTAAISGSDTFIGLTDTPSSYAGQGGNIPFVNQSENGIEFATPSDAPRSFEVGIGNRGQAISSTGYTYVYSVDTNNQVQGSTGGQGGGINNGELFPLPASEGKVIETIDIEAGAMAVSGGTKDPNIFVRLRFWCVEYSGRIAFTTAFVDVPVVNVANVNTFNNLGGFGGDTVRARATGLNIAVPDGCLWGVDFQNVSGSGNVNAIGRFYIDIEGTQT